MRSRADLRAERREAERQAHAAAGRVFSFASGEGLREASDAARGECGGSVIADPAETPSSVSNRSNTDERPDVLTLAIGDGPPGLVKLRTMPVRDVLPVHPLRTYIEARDLGVAEAAALLDVSARSLRDILSWRARFPRRKSQFIARYLHVDPDALFPPRP